MIKEAIDRHKKIALMFSGGKDSLACLYLLKPYWNKITVMWVNTGDIFPENEAIVRQHAALVPNFIEIKSDVAEFKRINGLPSDLVPIQNTSIGQIMTGAKNIKLVSGYDCCAFNMWKPAIHAAQNLGVTLIIRGQRNQEYAKSSLRSGEKMDGFEFLFPIENWSQDEVLSYLKGQGFDYPEFFNFVESSLDCMHCTAFLDGIADRRDYMKKNHPEVHAENQDNLAKIFSAITHSYETMRGAA